MGDADTGDRDAIINAIIKSRRHRRDLASSLGSKTSSPAAQPNHHQIPEVSPQFGRLTWLLQRQQRKIQNMAIPLTDPFPAQVSVWCSCPCGLRTGTRVFGPNSVDGCWHVYDVAQMPADLPVVKGILDAIGTAIGNVIQQVTGGNGLVADPTTLAEMGAAVRQLASAGPSKPSDGAWQGGVSPCDKK